MVSYSPAPITNPTLPHTSTTSFSPIMAGNRTYVWLLPFQQQTQPRAVITLFPPFPNQRQAKGEQSFHILRFRAANWCIQTWDCLWGVQHRARLQRMSLPWGTRGGTSSKQFMPNKSPFHPQSERTDTKFPKKITIRVNLFSSHWHRALSFINV